MIKHTQSTAEFRIRSARHQILDHSHSPSPTAMPIIPQKLVPLPSMHVERLSLHTRCSQVIPARQGAVAQRLSGNVFSASTHSTPIPLFPVVCYTAIKVEWTHTAGRFGKDVPHLLQNSVTVHFQAVPHPVL